MTRRIDPGRVLRALGLQVAPDGDGYRVTGGARPRRVFRTASGWTCDCPDAQYRPGEACKHRVAVHLHRQLAPAVRVVLAEAVRGAA